MQSQPGFAGFGARFAPFGYLARSIGVVLAASLLLCSVACRQPGRRCAMHSPAPCESQRQSAEPGHKVADTDTRNSAVHASPGRAADRSEALARVTQKHKRLMTEGPKPYDQPQAAMDFFLAQRMPGGMNELPVAHLRETWEEIKVREAVARERVAAGAGTTLPTWTEIGPGNIGGRTRAIVFHPLNPDTMYAAGVAGGIWKSTNAGASWQAADDFLLNLAVSTLAIVEDPPGQVTLYAGTGEGFFNSDSVRGLGIFKSTDAGDTWEQLSGTVTGVPTGAFYRVNDIVISPSDPTRIYAATRYGVWRSDDAGASWSVLLQNPTFLTGPEPLSNGCNIGCTELAIRTDTAPGNDVLLAAFGSFQADGLFRTSDSGASWTQVGTPADLLRSNQGRMALAVAPSQNNVMYVSMADNGGGNGTGTMVNVFRSIDGGISWSPRLDPTNPMNALLLSNLVLGNGCWGVGTYAQGWYDNVIAVDPANPDQVWVGGIDLFRSDNGGEDFGVASYWYFDPTDPNYVHADHHALVFHPDYDGTTNQTLYSGSDGGLARTDNARAAASPFGCPPPAGDDPLPDILWTGLNNGYGVTQFYHGDSARDEDTFGGGAQDNGTNLVNSATTPDDWREGIGGDGGYFAIDPTNSQVMYGETQNFPRIMKSTDGGDTFSIAVNGITDFDGLFISPFAMDQASPNILWTGGNRPWRTKDGAASWSLAGSVQPNGFLISAIGIAPTDSNVVYLGFINGYIAKTTNGLADDPTWVEFGGGNGLNIDAWVSSIAVSPVDPNIAYCTYSTFDVPHVMRTADGGQTWVPLTGIGATGVPDIPAHWVAVRPCNADQLFVGTELGVFQSDDDGATWEPANDGLANTVVETLDFQNDGVLVAFTHGRGAFRAVLSCPCDPDLPTTDCNANGEPDECDIVLQRSADCNDNDIPDDCELTGNDCDGNGVPDECDTDCNANGIADACDINDGTSEDCSGNGVPDECEPDCNANGVPDECDIDDTDPDGDGLVSEDCNANGFPDECDTAGGGIILAVDFEGGLPTGWSTTGFFQVTSACREEPVCDPSPWAYAGNAGDCTYGDNEIGQLVSPPITLAPVEAELRYCSLLDSELDYDFAEVYVNGDRVVRESGLDGVWETRTVDLNAYRGQTVTITFQFASDMSVSGTLGWQVDQIRVSSGSSDCNGNGIPDECESLPDIDGNGVPDMCECTQDSDCNDGLFCNGAETCTALNVCVPGPPPCSEGFQCDEAANECLCDDDADCDDGLFCSGPETCDGTGACVDGAEPCADGEVCDEAMGQCVECLTLVDCDDGLFCNGLELCDGDGNCVTGTSPCSGGFACDDDANRCICDDNGDCDDGVFCNGAEVCNETGDCMPGSAACGTSLTCDEGNSKCICDEDSDCDDGLFCNGSETCGTDGACASGTPPCTDGQGCVERDRVCLECLDAKECDDGDACTADTCPNGVCTHTLLPACKDDDGDGVLNADDICPDGSDTLDADGDGLPDGCDACPNDPDNDRDNDDVCGDRDNCPNTANEEQEDADGDELGDVCDPCPNDPLDDVDNDGVCGDLDNCPTIGNPTQADADRDAIGDVCDNCPEDAENDFDRDGICGNLDICPGFDDRIDTDADGAPDGCDRCPSDPENDADGDNVCGNIDQCADTPLDEVADARGCGPSQIDPATGAPLTDLGTGLGLGSGTGTPVPGTCGVLGMIPFATIILGLATARTRRRRRE